MRLRSAQPGFSFIEILVSTAVVLVLAAMVYGPSKTAVDQKKSARCTENLRRLHLSLGVFANEHDGSFPAKKGATASGEVLSALVPKYTAEDAVLSCDGMHYAYVMGLKREDTGMLAADRFASLSQPLRMPQDGAHGPDNGNLLFTDGHVEPFAGTARRDLRIPFQATLLNP